MSGTMRWGLSFALITAVSMAGVQAVQAQQTNTTQTNNTGTTQTTNTGAGTQSSSGNKGITTDATGYKSGKHNVVVGDHHGY